MSEKEDPLKPARGILLGTYYGFIIWICLILGSSAVYAAWSLLKAM